VSFAATTLRVASQRVFIDVSVYFVIDSVRKLLDTSSYIKFKSPLFKHYDKGRISDIMEMKHITYGWFHHQEKTLHIAIIWEVVSVI
jgi:hypothetical protein